MAWILKEDQDNGFEGGTGQSSETTFENALEKQVTNEFLDDNALGHKVTPVLSEDSSERFLYHNMGFLSNSTKWSKLFHMLEFKRQRSFPSIFSLAVAS